MLKSTAVAARNDNVAKLLQTGTLVPVYLKLKTVYLMIKC